MDRDSIFKIKDGDVRTFEKDNDLPSLPLPELEDTLERYLESLKPFGTEDELKNSQKIIRNFANGIGKKLHNELVIKAAKEKNWVEKWWEDYAYHALRNPLFPYTAMTMPVYLRSVDTPETHEYSLKALARCLYYTLEFWDLMRQEKLRPTTSADGKIFFSSFLYRRFCCTTRVPGETQDSFECYFKTVSEGPSPTHGIVIGKGRIFTFDCLNKDGTILSPQQLLAILQLIRSNIDCQDVGACVPVLTSDERPSWAKNRKHLQELSPRNKELLKIVESSVLKVCLDEHEPVDYSESSLMATTGDSYSKWADRSSILVAFKNGKISCIGEHSAYDGTISVSYGLFILLSYLEGPEPDWSVHLDTAPLPVEVIFDLDDHLTTEIKRVMKDCESRNSDVIVAYSVFTGYGKEFMKASRIHPDSFVQMILQLAYFKLHKEFPATYETALMRNYYNGRTETLRSCTTESTNFVKIATNPVASEKEIFEAFKTAVARQNFLMSEARKGNGIDRHLFGLWCVAYEKNLEVPDLYSDPLYSKSGGGGNFILSTSTLGFTCQSGFVAPMVLDGYGAFYSITSEQVSTHVSTYRGSSKTSAMKFIKVFEESMLQMQEIIQKNLGRVKL